MIVNNKCGKREVKITETTQITRNNGRNYTIRNNRDRFFYPGEWIRFEKALKPSQLKTFDCLINTGARINEIRHLKKEDVDFDNKRLILRVTKIMALRKETVSRPRTIPISTQFARRLRAYFNSKAVSDYLGLLSTPAANIAMKKALQEAGIKDWQMFSVHNIRKTLENWLVALDMGDMKIISHFGHSRGIALRHYLSSDVFSSEEKMKIRDIIGDLYQQRY